MKYNLKKYWLLIAILPFAIMILLHIGIFINKLTNINFNIPNISAADWFIFAGSYLGGVITLGGVILTIKHERTINLKQVRLSEVLQEKEKLGEILIKTNLYAPSAYYQEYSTMTEMQNSNEHLSSIRKALVEEKGKLDLLRTEIIFLTDVFFVSSECNKCKRKCNLNQKRKKIVGVYNKINKTLFNTYEILDELIMIHQESIQLKLLIKSSSECDSTDELIKSSSECDSTDELIKSSSECDSTDELIKRIEESEKELASLMSKQFKIVNDMHDNEYNKLIALCREYIEIRKNNIENDFCLDK